jgi:hypothetical protein
MRHSALQTRIVRAIIIGHSAAVCLLLAGELASAATGFANPGTSASNRWWFRFRIASAGGKRFVA